MRSRTLSLPAPNQGWVQNVNLRERAGAQAEVLDNFYPTSRSVKLRGGTGQVALLPNPAKALMPYPSASELIAADDENLYVIDAGAAVLLLTPGGTEETATTTGLTNGDWSYTQFANSSGEYLYMVNGADSPHTYNGTTIAAQTVTGVTNLSAVWPFGKRLFFVEKDTQSAWYLAPNAIAGSATEFPLQGLFSRGGSLLFGSSWSSDSGEGLDDNCVFVTDQGQVAVYTGTDPSSDFSLQGIYEIGRPLSKNAWFRAGGDLAILTDEGIVSLAAAATQDKSALTQSAITYPIEQAWQEAVANRNSNFPFGVTFWRRDRKLVVSGGQDNGTPFAFVANSDTGAWCRYVNWDIQSSCEMDGNLYFGNTDGSILQGEVGGMDLGEAVEATCLSRFDVAGNLALKEGVHARIVARSNITSEVEVFANADYIIDPPGTVDATSSIESLEGTWGTAVWGGFTWGGEAAQETVQTWQTVTASGSALAVGAKVRSENTGSWNLEIAGFDLVYHEGNLL